MKRRSLGLAVATLMTLVAICFFSTGAMAAQASTAALVAATKPVRADAVRPNEPDFTCPSETVCIFPDLNQRGNYGSPWDGPALISPDLYGGEWYTFNAAGVTPNPGSATNNSGSAFYAYALDSGDWVCMYGNVDSKYNLRNAFGWFYTTYGNPECTDNLPGGGP